MKASAKERAARLVARIEKVIERGEFTPECRYLGIDTPYSRIPIGPCGCAVGAAAFLAGAEADVNLRSVGLITFLARANVMSDAEARQLEAGYEAWDGEPSGPFLDAGRELRKFHPTVRA